MTACNSRACPCSSPRLASVLGTGMLHLILDQGSASSQSQKLAAPCQTPKWTNSPHGLERDNEVERSRLRWGNGYIRVGLSMGPPGHLVLVAEIFLLWGGPYAPPAYPWLTPQLVRGVTFRRDHLAVFGDQSESTRYQRHLLSNACPSSTCVLCNCVPVTRATTSPLPPGGWCAGSAPSPNFITCP